MFCDYMIVRGVLPRRVHGADLDARDNPDWILLCRFHGFWDAGHSVVISQRKHFHLC